MNSFPAKWVRIHTTMPKTVQWVCNLQSIHFYKLCSTFTLQLTATFIHSNSICTHKLHDTPSRLLTQCSRESKLHLKNARTHIVAIHKTTNTCATISSYKFKTVLIALQQCFNILKTRQSEFFSCKMGPRTNPT